MSLQESLWAPRPSNAVKEVVMPVVEKKGVESVEEFLSSIAKEYVTAIRGYNNAICSGRMEDGERTPATSIEAKFTGRYARLLLQEFQHAAKERHGLPPGDVNAAIRLYKEESRDKK